MERRNRWRRGIGVFAVGLTLFGTAGCAVVRRTDGPPPLSPGFARPALKENASWWVYRFRMHWPEGTPADMAVDLLLAHAVVKPALEGFAADLACWRFHRRAARDAIGHQFSFLFYTDPATAEALYAELHKSVLTAALRRQGVVAETIEDDPRNPGRPGIADTSDPQWSPMMQRQWPSYIMGVSLLWLGLIDEAVAELPPELREGDDRLALYRAADERIAGLWYREGQHALLHHLSAVFGYHDLLIVKPMRF